MVGVFFLDNGTFPRSAPLSSQQSIVSASVVWYDSKNTGNLIARKHFQAFRGAYPFFKFSTKYSAVRSVNARIEIVVVLSVQLGNTLASQTYKFGTSCDCPNRFVTNRFGSLPIRSVPVSCRLVPGISGSGADP